MYFVLQARASEILERFPARSLPLSRLHEILSTELGPAAGTYHDLQASLRQSTGRFLVMEPQDPLASADEWPAEVRAAYSRQLMNLPGGETMVALARPAALDEGPLGLLHQTLADLHDAGVSVVELYREMALLHDHLARAEQSTTPPPPRSSGR